MDKISAIDKKSCVKRARAIFFCSISLVALFAFSVYAQQPRVSVSPPPPPPPAPSPSPVASTREEIDEGDVERIETQLVTVPVVVTNSAGGFIAGLRAENFLLAEDNRPQRISNFSTTEAPFEVALLLDTSGSTCADIALIRRAALAFIDALRAGDRVAILSFKTTRDEDAPTPAVVEINQNLTDDREALRRAVEDIGASAGTPFYDSLLTVTAQVFNASPREEVRGRRALVALTDGVDSASEADFAEARAALVRRNVLCYFIQINTEAYVEERLLRDCQDEGTLQLSRSQLERYRRLFAPRADADDYRDFCRLGEFQRMEISRQLYNLARREMNELARSTGGRTFAAVELRDARRAFAEVAAEIGTVYSLGYYPTNTTRDGRFRRISVTLRGVSAGAQVRARPGYTAPRN